MEGAQKTDIRRKLDQRDSKNMSELGFEEMPVVDWRGRPCKPSKHGGMTAAVFVLGIFLFLSPYSYTHIYSKIYYI